jgi:hypothetical protein
VVVAAYSANPAGDEVRVSRIFAFHENAVAAENRRGAVAFRHLTVLKIDLREYAQAAHDASDGIPIHFDEFP